MKILKSIYEDFLRLNLNVWEVLLYNRIALFKVRLLRFKVKFAVITAEKEVTKRRGSQKRRDDQKKELPNEKGSKK